MVKYIKSFFKEKDSYDDGSIVFGEDICLSSNVDYIDLALQNPAIHRAVSLIVNSITRLDVVVKHKGNVTNDSLAAAVLFNPVEAMSFSDFIESFVWQYLLFGNAYIVLSENRQSITGFDLVVLDSNNVSILLDKKTHSKVAAYAYTMNSDVMIFDASLKTPCIGHFKNYNPKNRWYGYSFIEPVKISAKLYQQIDQHNYSIVLNGGRPSGILSMNSNRPMSESQKEEFARKFHSKYSGPNNAGEILFLHGDCQWHPLSSNVKDMDYSDSARRALRVIATGLGVPANLVGDTSLSGENTKSNMDALLSIFSQTTISPLAKKISGFLTIFFRKALDSQIEILLIDKESDN